MLKLLIPAVLLSAVFPSVAPAQEAAPAAVHVAYRDLDLRSPAGLRALDRRLAQAIARVCPYDGTELARKAAVSRCRTAKWADVNGQRAAILKAVGGAPLQVAATRPVR